MEHRQNRNIQHPSLLCTLDTFLSILPTSQMRGGGGVPLPWWGRGTAQRGGCIHLQPYSGQVLCAWERWGQGRLPWASCGLGHPGDGVG